MNLLFLHLSGRCPPGSKGAVPGRSSALLLLPLQVKPLFRLQLTDFNTLWYFCIVKFSYKLPVAIICFPQCCGSEMILFRILIRIRIQLWIFQDPDPNPGKSSRSMRIRIRIQPILIKFLYFEIIQKHLLNSLKKKNFNNYFPFSIPYYCTIIKTVKNSQFYIYALSYFAGSGSGTNNSRSGKKFRIRPDPDPQHLFSYY